MVPWMIRAALFDLDGTLIDTARITPAPQEHAGELAPAFCRRCEFACPVGLR